MATIIGVWPNTYNINGKYMALVGDGMIWNQDYMEVQTGFIGVGKGREAIICDAREELLYYIAEHNLFPYEE